MYISSAHYGPNVTHVDSATRTHATLEAWVSCAIDRTHKAHVKCLYHVLMSFCDVRAQGGAERGTE